MTRLVSLTVLVVVLAASRLASAQSTDGSDSGTLPNGATIQYQHLKTYYPDKKDFQENGANSDDRLRAFNLASCTCARANRGASAGVDAVVPAETDLRSVGWFQYLLIESAQSGVRKPGQIWVGTSCQTDTQRTTAMACKPLPYAAIGDIDNALYPGGSVRTFNLYDVVNGKTHETEPCLPTEGNATIYTFVSTTGSTDTFDYSTTTNAGTLSSDSTTAGSAIDTTPPPAPDDLVALPSDESINLQWSAPGDRNTDIAYYQALCADATNSVARTRAADRRHATTRSLCEASFSNLTAADLAPEELEPVVSSDENEDAVEAPTGGFGDLNEAFICGEATSGTSDSLRITGLKNNTKYKIILLSVDLHGNYTGLYLDHTVTPIPVTDFWEDLHDGDGGPQGGLCLLAETYGDHSSLTNTLRGFRDDTLGGSRIGRWLGRAYYATLGKLGGLVHGSLALRVVAGVLLAPLVALALAWHWLTLPGLLAALIALGLGWRWRARLMAMLRGRRWAVLGGVILVALAPGLARADKFQPYWENDPLDKSKDSDGAAAEPNYDPTFDHSLETHDNNRSSNPFIDEKERDQDVVLGPEPTRFYVGIKLGPYFPDIDKQAGKPSYGPYRQMFGGYNLMPMLDVDWVPWTNDYGQLTLGGSIGYLQKKADGFVDGSTPGDHYRKRVPGAENKFQLLPIALLAGYRFTYLDDVYGIPLVPYVRGGLSYYVWRVTAPSGGVAEICDDTGTTQMCDNKALGASIGVQGAIGLAIRLERIDAGTAKSMRNSGIQHVGIYGELSIAKVDGFGSDSKLSVGDRTWFAGLDFEF